MNIRDWLLPQEKIFFEFLEEQIMNVCKGAELLENLSKNYKNVSSVRKKMKQIEKDGDDIVHRFYLKLNNTFITPIDQEDLTALISLFDDILDRCFAVTNRFYLYKIERMTKDAQKFVWLINEQLAQIKRAVLRIKKMERKEIDSCCVEIHRLENEGDEIFDKVQAEIFIKEKDIKLIIKLREIYGLLEETIDKCEDAAIAIRNIVVKNA